MGSSENPLYLLSDTKGIQWDDTDATLRTPVSTEGALKIENGSNLIAMQ